MTADARAKGFTPVMVHLESVGLNEISANPRGVRERMQAKANALLAELGQAALSAGRDENSIGQMTINVTEAGLKILQSSARAISFSPGRPLQSRSFVFPENGSFAAIERELVAQGHAQVQVTLNIEALQYDLSADGTLKFTAPGSSIDAAAAQARALLEPMNNQEAEGHLAAIRQFEAVVGKFSGQPSAPINPEFTLRVTREALEKLATSKQVRSIKPAGFIDQRPAEFATRAIEQARKYGTARVIISLRPPLASLGLLTKDSFDANTASNLRALKSSLASASVRDNLSDYASIGAMAAHLNVQQLQALQAAAKSDRRLLGVSLNEPIAEPALATSTGAASTNFVSAWNAPTTNPPGGYRGAGQNIIVPDTGVAANHAFLRKADGSPKVTYEACFGSNDPSSNYRSICPNQIGATGDSPLGLIGSATASAHHCSTTHKSSCDHGTHVAGIAAGRFQAGVPSLVGLQGVANEANIIAVQVYSFDKVATVDNEKVFPSAFREDMLAFIQAVVTATSSGVTTNSYTIVLSFSAGGGSTNQTTGGGACLADGRSLLSPTPTDITGPFETAIATLFARGVPAVAATGNFTSRRSISWPACVKRVIKVGGITNDNMQAVPSRVMLSNPADFPGDFWFMAPGFDILSSALSSGVNNTNLPVSTTASYGGTSFAAPHVAGLYALIKAAIPGISVDAASDYINKNLSKELPLICGLGNLQNVCHEFRRILMPPKF